MFKGTGYKWQQWVAKQAGKVRERVHPSQRKMPEPTWRSGKWTDLSDEQRAQAIEDERLRHIARAAERHRIAQREKEHQRALRLEQNVLRAKRRALIAEEAKLQREEERLASRLRADNEQQQWDYEQMMEDYVVRGITPGGKP
jgi:hypothetical protein